MDEGSQVVVTGDTQEAVAFALYQQLLTGQQHIRASRGQGNWSPPKDWILQTYAECLAVVKNGSYTPAGASSTAGNPSSATGKSSRSKR